jgi:hypothetical protein
VVVVVGAIAAGYERNGLGRVRVTTIPASSGQSLSSRTSSVFSWAPLPRDC